MIRFIVTSLLLLTPVLASAEKSAGFTPFTLPPLPYRVDALAPVIDAETMTLHHDKHHRGYVDKLNAEVEKNPALHGKSLEEILAEISKAGPVARNQAGGHWNHRFFWQEMLPEKAAAATRPSASLEEAIRQKFGTMDRFKEAFQAAGEKQFGSGWVWLIVNAQGALEITTTANQDNPLMDVAPVKGMPILGNDLWEHAYYLSYRNRRADYLKSWWRLVDWAGVSKRYEEALVRSR
jgi:Fe-Mn family superoxide dismutase